MRPALIALFLSIAVVHALLAQQPADASKPAAEKVTPPPTSLVESTKLTPVAEGFTFTEGPLWNKDRLLFSDVQAAIIYAVKPGAEAVPPEDAEKFRPNSGNANGNTFDREGRLITAQHNGQVTRREKDGTITILAKEYEGDRLNSPNDVVVRSDGKIYFTDPPFGVKAADRKLKYSGVFMIDPSADGTSPSKLTLVTKDLELPNGIGFTPDEKHLYITDYRKQEIYIFDVAADGMLSGKRLFIDLKTPGAKGGCDGLKLDTTGNIYATGPGGVWVVSPEGKPLGRIDVPSTTNVAFGGEDFKTLFITTGDGVVSVRTKTAGIRPGAPAQTK